MELVFWVRRLWRSRAGIEGAWIFGAECAAWKGNALFGVYGMVYDFGLVRIEVRCLEVLSLFFLCLYCILLLKRGYRNCLCVCFVRELAFV